MNRIKMTKMDEDKESDFYIAYCVRDRSGNLNCVDTQNINNKDTEGFIYTYNYICFITDKDGNIIHEVNRKQNSEKKVNRFRLDYVRDNDIVITEQDDKYVPIKTSFIHYIHNNIEKRVLFDSNKGGELVNISFPNKEKDTLIIWRKDKITGRDDMRLFNVKKGKFISPSLSKITKTKENDSIVMFEDEVLSNKENASKRYKTILTGFITLDGTINNLVYDSEINHTREIGMKPGRLIEGYKRFRNKVKKELDYKFEEEQQIERKKKKFEANAIAQLRLRIKK